MLSFRLKNNFHDAKAKLGEQLFNDKSLQKRWKPACANLSHNPEKAFSPPWTKPTNQFTGTPVYRETHQRYIRFLATHNFG
jgi:cytochrome c peroxidase